MIGTRLAILALGALAATSAAAASLTVVKAMTTVSDPQGNLLPKAVPGAGVDYTVTVRSPLFNGTASGMQFDDAIPARTVLQISDLTGAGSGPVEFLDGSLLGTGLLGTNLTYSYKGLADDTDSIQFSSNNGATWTYHPSDQGGGFDARVTNIRVVLGGTQGGGTTFRLRFRVKLL